MAPWTYSTLFLLQIGIILLAGSISFGWAPFASALQSPRPPQTLAAETDVTHHYATLHYHEGTQSNLDEYSSTIESACTEQQLTRRFVLNGIRIGCMTATSLVSHRAWAADRDDTEFIVTGSDAQNNNRGRKPYAPLENLLPATRVKVLIDEAVDTAAMLVDSRDTIDSNNKKEHLIAKLKSLLLEPQEFFKTKEEVETSKTYLNQQTWSDWKKARQDETRKMFQIQTDPATELNEAFEQWGERRQFKRLRRQQLALEHSNNMRAAFNAFTNNLVFGESYTLNANREEKKRLIRQYDQLPDVTSVIRSDLDLRDLYRNQILTAMDDAKAELNYQMSISEESSRDFSELLSILREAQSSCLEWFKFVPENDLKDALDVVRSE